MLNHSVLLRAAFWIRTVSAANVFIACGPGKSSIFVDDTVEGDGIFNRFCRGNRKMRGIDASPATNILVNPFFVDECLKFIHGCSVMALLMSLCRRDAARRFSPTNRFIGRHFIGPAAYQFSCGAFDNNGTHRIIEAVGVHLPPTPLVPQGEGESIKRVIGAEPDVPDNRVIFGWKNSAFLYAADCSAIRRDD
jgi:hypothetical protein